MAKVGFGERLKQIFGLSRWDEDFFDDLIDSLIEGDLGAKHAYQVAEELKEACKRNKLDSQELIKAELVAIIARDAKSFNLRPEPDILNFFLVLGVNGVGKTTSIAKLGNLYAKEFGKDKVILAAADTFRAAAIDQIEIHGERLGLRVVRHQSSSDPGAVIFDAIEAAKASKAAVVLADTAGRLHNKAHLVKELEKIDKIVSSKIDGGQYRKILVLDATTGQNGLRQAEAFNEAVGLDSVIITKYDSTARGGLALAIYRELGIPTAFVCEGEGYDDIRPFDPDSYVKDFIG
jgi:fused signal recognition particle receptor